MVETKSSLKVTSNKTSKPSLKTLIRKYLIVDCHIKKDIKNVEYDFAFSIRYPKLLDKDGNQLGKFLGIQKPKGKNDFTKFLKKKLPKYLCI